MQCKVVRERGVDINFPDIISDTDYVISPILAQRDSEVAQAQQTIKQYFAENFLTDNPDAKDALYFFNQQDQIVKSQQQAQTQADWQSEQASYNVQNPILQVTVQDYSGLLTGMYNQNKESPTLNNVVDTVENLEESLAWLIAQTAYVDEFISRTVCCMLLFSNKLKPEVFWYLNGQQQNETELKQELTSLKQDIQETIDVINALDFSQLANMVNLQQQTDSLETTYMSVMNQQFAQLLNKLNQIISTKYMPALDKLQSKSLLDQNATITDMTKLISQQYETQLENLKRTDVYSHMSKLQRTDVENKLKSEFDAIQQQVWSSLSQIRIPDGTKIGEICAPLFSNISSQLNNVAQGFFVNILNLLKQYYYTAPKFENQQQLSVKQSNSILKRCAQQLQTVQDSVSTDQQGYAQLQRQCFNLNITLDWIQNTTSQQDSTSSDQSSDTTVPNTARTLKYGIVSLGTIGQDVANKITLSMSDAVSSKLQGVLNQLRGFLPKGGS